MRSLILPLALMAACTPATTDEPVEESPLLDLPAAATWKIPGLKGEAHVVYGELDVPWVYAENEEDLGRVVGFVLARDRLFYMELARRLSQGRISELLGEAGLDTDISSRSMGMTYIVDHLEDLVADDAEVVAYLDGVAAGINAVIAEMKAGKLPVPSEIGFAGPVFEFDTPEDMLTDFTRRDVIAGLVTLVYETAFETGDIGRARDAARLATAMEGWAHEELRRGGLVDDIWGNTAPPNPVASAPDWLAAHPPVHAASTRRGAGARVGPGVLDRLHAQTQRLEDRLGHDWIGGFGSNAWAVSADASADGRAMLASDGHLQLSVPPLFYQIGVDTQHLGDGDVHQVGLMTPAMPFMSTGTNGKVAFGQTNLMGDITDWYAEEIVLDGAGAPRASIFQGAEEPLLAYQEDIVIAEVGGPFGGAGGTLSFTRYTTFDGRWISSIEGDEVDGPEAAPEGTTAVLLGGTWIVPRDVDGLDGITAVSFDYTGLDLSNMMRALEGYNRADSVEALADASEDLVAYGLNLVAADDSGDIFYTSFQAVPCRDYLDRNPDGTWADGADPSLLLDGKTYPGFTIPLAGGKVDHSRSDEPTHCVIPFDETPHAFTPSQGYLVTANNDPGGLSLDGTLTNDARYFGGPWIEGYRADAISRDLRADIADGGVTVDDMKEGQANHESTLAVQLLPELLDALDVAEALAGTPSGGPGESPETRMSALWTDNAERFEEARDRLRAWQTRGLVAESGVETFYHQPTAEQRQDAVATMIFNAWLGRFVGFVVGDEDIPGLGWPTGDTGRTRVLTMALEGRGADNPLDLASWNPVTEEPIYFDIVSTPHVETSDEVAVLALRDALDFLGTEPVDGQGGFGTDDMEAWIWGLRHLARMTSLLGDFLGAGGPFDVILAPFNITPDTLPLADGIGADDPRYGLKGFPRPGDHLGVDALNSGLGGTSFTSDSGSVMRFVVALGGEKGFEAYNVIPGGQSGLIDSPHFADQARLWLGNEYLPVWLEVGDVVAHGKRREAFVAE